MRVPVPAERRDLALKGEFRRSGQQPCELSRAQKSHLGMMDMLNDMMMQAVTEMAVAAAARGPGEPAAPKSSRPIAAHGVSNGG
jgi:hypothetical protein